MELTGPNVLDQCLFQDSRNLVASMVERSGGGLSLASSILFSHAASNSTYSRALLYASVGSERGLFLPRRHDCVS